MDIQYFDMVNNKQEILFNIPFKILNELNTNKYDIIIGLPTIYEYSILLKLAPIFMKECGGRGVMGTSYSPSYAPLEGNIRSPNLTNTGSHIYLSSISTDIVKEDKFIDYIINEEDGIFPKDYSYLWERGDEDSDNLPKKIYGSYTFVQEVKQLCAEYSTIFSRTLKPEPANLPPLEFEIDEKGWHIPQNMGPPRTQSVQKEKEIQKQCNEMLKLGIIRSSQAPYYSQVHLTPKPNDKWRFAIDYRKTNLVLKKFGWPLPNIQQMLMRIGNRKPKIFAKFDMTSGFFQLPMSEQFKKYTAFITYMGVFEWNRVPMGLTPSANWFQYLLSTIVLAGLTYLICELLIDDVLTFAEDEEELLRNLKTIFERFKQYNIIIHPDKCEIGLKVIEYCGAQIDSEGMKFTDDKLSGVREFPLPDTKGKLKSFNGLANHFRNHVKNYAMLSHSLEVMLPNYTKKQKNHKLNWSNEQIEAFEKLKEAVCNCQKLYFIDHTSENVTYTMQTDASDYGIGAYLFQTIDEIEYPIKFVSKSLNARQLNWSVPEKECYAAYYAFNKLEYLLSDIEFTWETDHVNLTRITTNATSSPKVLRWKLYMQEFNYLKKQKYIQGEINEIADTLSRLCECEDKYLLASIYEFEEDDDPSLKTLDQPEIIASTIEIKKIPDKEYKILASIHNSINGHFGINRTINKLKTLGHNWQYMRQYVQLFIKHCPLCQKLNEVKSTIQSIPFTLSSYEPMKTIGIDTLGPLPEDDDGNTHVIVIKDHFTKTTELYPSKSTTAQEAEYALFDWVSRYGIPTYIVSDNGPQYVNKLIDEFMKLTGSTHNRTMTYSKEQNAIVERANKEILRHLRALIFELRNIKQWKQMLPFVRRIINSSAPISTGIAPVKLITPYLNLENNILTPFDESEKDINLTEYSEELLRVQEKLIHVASQRQKNIDDNNLKRREPTEDIPEFPINSFVLVEYPATRIGRLQPNKLLTTLKGPMRVVKKLDSNNYEVYDLVTQKIEPIHHSRMSTFKYMKNHTDPHQVANSDYDNSVIDKVLKHTGDPKDKTNMDFYVSWVNAPDSANLWLPWKEIRNNIQLHEYLRNNNMTSLIPREHRESLKKRKIIL